MANTRQATPNGASRMAQSRIFIEAANRPSRSLTAVSPAAPTWARAAPKVKAKNMTARMPLPLELPSNAPTISWSGFSGMMSSSVSFSDLAPFDLAIVSAAPVEY